MENIRWLIFFGTFASEHEAQDLEDFSIPLQITEWEQQQHGNLTRNHTTKLSQEKRLYEVTNIEPTTVLAGRRSISSFVDTSIPFLNLAS